MSTVKLRGDEIEALREMMAGEGLKPEGANIVSLNAAPAQEAQILEALDRAADRPVRWGVRCHCYSIFTPAAFTTSPHFTR